MIDTSNLTIEEADEILKDFVYLYKEIFSTILAIDQEDKVKYAREFIKNVVMDNVDQYRQEPAIFDDDLPF